MMLHEVLSAIEEFIEMSFIPSYRELCESGRLGKIAEELKKNINHCTLCPHECRVDRSVGEYGYCESGINPVVSSWNAHFGEEAPLVGRRGSGTIFFAHCNLRCIYCQNFDISHLGYGKEISYRDLGLMMISLQERGCHNINFVTPSHMVYAIVEALLVAVPMGLKVPLVYNSGGYDSVKTLRLIEGLFDIYMPDFKYSDTDTGFRLSGIRNYPEVAREAIIEMHNQVGELKMDSSGVAYRGLLVRHLVLPNDLSGTYRVIDFLHSVSKNTFLNIMDQYHPEYRARECHDLGRRLTYEEYDRAVSYARSIGMTRAGRM